ncbi:MAG: DUF4862 family protein [Nakamurella sp.]
MKLIVGAYPAQPPGHADRAAFYSELAEETSIRGLELPYRQDGGEPWPAGAHTDWTAVITAIPGTMQKMGRDPYFGLASSDPTGRAAALSYAADIRDYAESLTADGHRVEAIELHSAPLAHGSAEALTASLHEILSWNWHDAAITIEHCDAPAAGREPEKGFLPLAAEIEIVRELREAGHQTGLIVNWGRSVIQGHHTQTAVDHINAAQQAGVLSGVMFSGCSPQETELGYPWIDAHLPAREIQDAPQSSLLDQHQIRRSLNAAGTPPIIGFKVAVTATAVTAAERARRIRHMCGLVTSCL